MGLQASVEKKVFRFNFKVRTSRGLMENKTSWFIKLWDDFNPEVFGIGECGPLPGLSLDARSDFEDVLTEVMKGACKLKSLPSFELANISSKASAGDAYRNVLQMIRQHFKEIIPPHFPSIIFGVETASLDLLQGGKRIIFRNDFLKGKSIPINGLIWMGEPGFMMHQIEQKIAQGFRCIKLKVGGLNFDDECDVLRKIRSQYTADEITIRLDANGAFQPDEALFKLDLLSKYDIHSVEQPIKEGQIEMGHICQKSPIPIALDEELIACEQSESKQQLLNRIKPSYIILKPMLHGGFTGCQEWIELAERKKIGWWLTSALESNIGLNAICQFTGNYDTTLPQGLGTGAIYQNNIDSLLNVERGHIFLNAGKTMDSR